MYVKNAIAPLRQVGRLHSVGECLQKVGAVKKILEAFSFSPRLLVQSDLQHHRVSEQGSRPSNSYWLTRDGITLGRCRLF